MRHINKFTLVKCENCRGSGKVICKVCHGLDVIPRRGKAGSKRLLDPQRWRDRGIMRDLNMTYLQEIGKIPSPEHVHYRDRLDTDRFRLTIDTETMYPDEYARAMCAEGDDNPLNGAFDWNSSSSRGTVDNPMLIAKMVRGEDIMSSLTETQRELLEKYPEIDDKDPSSRHGLVHALERDRKLKERKQDHRDNLYRMLKRPKRALGESTKERRLQELYGRNKQENAKWKLTSMLQPRFWERKFSKEDNKAFQDGVNRRYLPQFLRGKLRRLKDAEVLVPKHWKKDPVERKMDSGLDAEVLYDGITRALQDPDLTDFQREKIQWLSQLVLDPRRLDNVPPELAKKHMKSYYSKRGEEGSDERDEPPSDLERALVMRALDPSPASQTLYDAHLGERRVPDWKVIWPPQQIGVRVDQKTGTVGVDPLDKLRYLAEFGKLIEPVTSEVQRQGALREAKASADALQSPNPSANPLVEYIDATGTPSIVGFKITQVPWRRVDPRTLLSRVEIPDVDLQSMVRCPHSTVAGNMDNLKQLGVMRKLRDGKRQIRNLRAPPAEDNDLLQRLSLDTWGDLRAWRALREDNLGKEGKFELGMFDDFDFDYEDLRNEWFDKKEDEEKLTDKEKADFFRNIDLEHVEIGPYYSHRRIDLKPSYIDDHKTFDNFNDLPDKKEVEEKGKQPHPLQAKVLFGDRRDPSCFRDEDVDGTPLFAGPDPEFIEESYNDLFRKYSKYNSGWFYKDTIAALHLVNEMEQYVERSVQGTQFGDWYNLPCRFPPLRGTVSCPVCRGVPHYHLLGVNLKRIWYQPKTLLGRWEWAEERRLDAERYEALAKREDVFTPEDGERIVNPQVMPDLYSAVRQPIDMGLLRGGVTDLEPRKPPSMRDEHEEEDLRQALRTIRADDKDSQQRWKNLRFQEWLAHQKSIPVRFRDEYDRDEHEGSTNQPYLENALDGEVERMRTKMRTANDMAPSTSTEAFKEESKRVLNNWSHLTNYETDGYSSEDESSTLSDEEKAVSRELFPPRAEYTDKKQAYDWVSHYANEFDVEQNKTQFWRNAEEYLTKHGNSFYRTGGYKHSMPNDSRFRQLDESKIMDMIDDPELAARKAERMAAFAAARNRNERAANSDIEDSDDAVSEKSEQLVSAGGSTPAVPAG